MGEQHNDFISQPAGQPTHAAAAADDDDEPQHDLWTSSVANME